MLGEVGLKAALADGVIRVYSGAQPAAADNAVTGTLLMEITVDAGAFSHGSATNGLEVGHPGKWPNQQAFWRYVERSWNCCRRSWWARYCANPLDDGTASTSLARVDMSVGKGSGDLQLSNVNVAVGAPITVDVATRLPVIEGFLAWAFTC